MSYIIYHHPHFGDYINPAKYTICHARNNLANIIVHTITHWVVQSIIHATLLHIVGSISVQK